MEELGLKALPGLQELQGRDMLAEEGRQEEGQFSIAVVAEELGVQVGMLLHPSVEETEELAIYRPSPERQPTMQEEEVRLEISLEQEGLEVEVLERQAVQARQERQTQEVEVEGRGALYLVRVDLG